MPVDYSRFDRLVSEDEKEDKRLEEERSKAEVERKQRELAERKRKEFEALRLAEDEWKRQTAAAGLCNSTGGAFTSVDEPLGAEEAPRAARIDAPTSDAPVQNAPTSDAPEQIDMADIDNFFRLPTEEEKEEKRKKEEEKKENLRLKNEAAGKQPLKDKGMTPEQVMARIAHLEADRLEMATLMDRCDRPAAKARLGELVLEMDDELARLREDPLELDDEDRRELRLFHLRKWQLPGSSRAQEVLSEVAAAPKALERDDGAPAAVLVHEKPWQEITMFALDLGGQENPEIIVDARVEAVERLPEGSVTCQFTKNSFDLRVVHALDGGKYRLVKTCLQHEIDPEQSSFRIKRNHIVVAMAKAQTPDDEKGASAVLPQWTHLCAAEGSSRKLPGPPDAVGRGRHGH